jgi:hypothetical protein
MENFYEDVMLNAFAVTMSWPSCDFHQRFQEQQKVRTT